MKKKRKTLYILLTALLVLLISSTTLSLWLERNPAIQHRTLITNLSQQDLPLQESLAKARLEISRNELNKAEILLLALVAKYPKESEVRLALGQVYCKQKRYQQAEQTYRQHTLYHPNLASGYQKLSAVQVKLANYIDAEKNILQARQLSPQDNSILLQAADFYALRNEKDKAMNFLYMAMNNGAEVSQIKNYPNIMKMQETP